jgi:CheY-like chemotaxis protein
MLSDRTSSRSPAARVLLVDDNRLGLEARKALLEEQSYVVETAREGQEALDAFLRAPFDLVVTDYKMPRMDGIKLISRIRGLSPETPIILISGFVDALGLTEQSTGADVVICKSATEVPQLVRSAKRLLNRSARKPVRSQQADIKVMRQAR